MSHASILVFSQLGTVGSNLRRLKWSEMELIDIENVVKAIQGIGPESTWKTPDGYPNSLALCVLDAIWSMGVNYDKHVVPYLKDSTQRVQKR